MSEFISQVMQRTPEDREICELTARIADSGVEITAKSEILGKYIKKVRQNSYSGMEFGAVAWQPYTFYSVGPKQSVFIPGHNSFSVDLFVPARAVFPGDNARHNYEPNMIWMLADGLETGITLIFPQPAHIPADIIDYLTRSMDKVRTFYLRHIQPFEAKATLTERK